MGLYEQEFIRPGKYHVGGGRYHTITAGAIQACVAGTKAMLAAGVPVPVYFEHPPLGSPEAVPQQMSGWDEKAERLKNQAGFLRDIRLGSDGAALYTIEATDKQADEKLGNKTIRHTSPQFMPVVVDGKGRAFPNAISHVALTGRPRNLDQTELTPVPMQFSLDDLVEPIQMADDSDEKKSDDKEGDAPSFEKKSEEPSNPDMPKETGPSDDSKQIEAILAHLNTLGVGLPADTDESNFKDRLLTALLTHEAMKAKEEAEKPKEEEEKPEQVVEQQAPGMQFSLDDAIGGKLENKLLARVIKQEHELLAGKLESMAKAGKITPNLRDRLLSSNGAMQFSAEGEHVVSFSLPQVVEILDKTLVPGMGITAEEALQFSAEVEHPKGDAFTKGADADPSPEEAKKLAAWAMGAKR